jgi:broad specificity phosphatase PhoE
LFAHAHLLRILAARWCGLPASAGANLVLDPASWSVLGHERTTPCIVRWNVTATIAR